MPVVIYKKMSSANVTMVGFLLNKMKTLALITFLQINSDSKRAYLHRNTDLEICVTISSERREANQQKIKLAKMGAKLSNE